MQSLHIVAGTNNCAAPVPITFEDTVSQFENMLKLAKETAETVTISSVLQRYNTNCDSGLLKRINNLNLKIKDICAENEVNFIDNDLTYKYANRDLDEDMFQNDGLHVSERGTKCLLHNLEVQDVISKCSTKHKPIHHKEDMT